MDNSPGYSRGGSRLSDIANVYGRRPNRLKLTSKVLEGINLQPGCQLLEVGCGEGMTSAFLADHLGAKVVGVDLEARIAPSFRQRLVSDSSGAHPSFCLGDLAQLPFPPGAFDYIWCESTLSTIDDKTCVVAEFQRLLKVGGKIIVLDFVLGKPVDKELQKSISYLPCLGRTKTAQDYFAIFESLGFTAVKVVDYTNEIKRSGYWLGMMFGSMDEVISRIVAGDCCKTSRRAPKELTMSNFQRFLAEASLGYFLFILSHN